MTLPPVLAMRPRFIEKLWAGARLSSLTAKQRVGHMPPPRTGESWEVADVPEGSTTVDGGALDGRSLRELVEKHGRALVGARASEGPDGVLRFPLLVKLIDAGDDLSVQVHPDQSYARAHPGTFSKDEAWLVVAVEPGATVLHGTRDGVTREQFARAIGEGRAHELLRTVRVSVGDVLRIAPGTIHAVGAGCVLLEVQEPSDTTFRVWDYGRKDVDGKARTLHVDQALAVANFGPQGPPLVGDLQADDGLSAPRRAGVATACYAMHMLDVVPGTAALVAREADEPAVLFVLDGEVDVEGTVLPQGAAALVPANARAVHARSSAPATLVVMTTGR